MNLIFHFFYREEVYKNVIDFFFSLPTTIIFSLMFFIIFINLSFTPLFKILNNLFFTFLITYLNLCGYLLLAYYLNKNADDERIFYLRLLGGIIFIVSTFAYTWIVVNPIIIHLVI
jgi:hypothetical protein